MAKSKTDETAIPTEDGYKSVEIKSTKDKVKAADYSNDDKSTSLKNNEATEQELKNFKIQILTALGTFGHVNAVFSADGKEVTLTNSLYKDRDAVSLPVDVETIEITKAAEELSPEDVQALKERQALASGKAVDPVALKADVE